MKNLLETYELMYYFLFAYDWKSFFSFVWIVSSLSGSTAFAQSFGHGIIPTMLIGGAVFAALVFLPLLANKLIKK